MCTYCLRADGSIPTYEEWLDMVEDLEKIAAEEAAALLSDDYVDADEDYFYGIENYM